MDKKKRSKPSDLSCIEDWMNQFFTDPFSALLDCRSFRVDLFETSEEYIVEAEFADVKPEDIQIKADRETLIITAQTARQTTESDQLERSILLPFSLEKKKIEAVFSNDILEVKIFKEGSCSRKSSYIPVQFAL
ncbi:Hsp20/alpha crystallin family protein [Metabacillus indicus]|uniref:Hsp20/alpha crystallin family protein n=1 Tax=Metabacillus indicus TaxID=246786 RepID=UPI0024934648|nr:Hsp20/alpha crystallin family protein [Metabacillus indicus]